MDRQRLYAAIDLKSFYASVECKELGYDPLTTNLVVADAARTEKTICLAVSPTLKSYGISGRARLFEVVQRVKEVNRERARRLGRALEGSSCQFPELERSPHLAVDYVTACPRMALYMKYSTRIYGIYLKYVAPEDIVVYSVDEVFIDLTAYLDTYGMTAEEMTRMLIRDVYDTTGITATAGIGTNLYLCKVAMDILAKHAQPDAYGVRMAELDEMSYRRLLWDHRPLTDFWRVGNGYARRLAEIGVYTMGEIARISVAKANEFYNEDTLYRMFGVNAELLIDHAWGWEPTTMEAIHAYRPETKSISSGQVLQSPYDYEHARLIVREMTDLLVLELVDKGKVTDQMTLTIGYDVENLQDPERAKRYHGEVTTDRYGRRVPKHAHGTANLPMRTSSTRIIMDAVTRLFERITDRELLVRRVNVTACRIVDEREARSQESYEQMDLFTDYEALARQRQEQEASLQRERHLQQAVLEIKKKYGKNAVLKGMNFEEGATTRERNRQVGGHRA